MVTNVRFLSSRRSYEYGADDISLTLLSNQGVVQHIRDTFSFSVGQPGSPMETFGPVAASLPPGLIFDYGATPFPKDSGTPIRFMHIEQRRIVIDLAGPSEAIEPTYQLLRNSLEGLKTFEGLPTIGEPERTLEYSEITFTMPVDPDALLPAALRPLVRKMLLNERVVDSVAPPVDKLLVPSFQVKLLPVHSEYPGYGLRTHDALTLELRAGTDVSEGVFFSGAPLNSGQHLTALEELANTLAS